MKKTFIPFTCFLIISCNSINQSKLLIDYKKEFKTQAYCNCIINGYNDNYMKNKILKIDKSLYSPFVYSFSGDKIKEIVEKELIKMKMDSINSHLTVAESYAGIQVLKHCLNFYNSKQLDSTALQEYKKIKNIKNIDSIFNIKNPNY